MHDHRGHSHGRAHGYQRLRLGRLPHDARLYAGAGPLKGHAPGEGHRRAHAKRDADRRRQGTRRPRRSLSVPRRRAPLHPRCRAGPRPDQPAAWLRGQNRREARRRRGPIQDRGRHEASLPAARHHHNG